MRVLLSLLVLVSFNTSSLACSGCSKSKGGNMASNIQSSPGSATNGLSGARMIASGAPAKAFKNAKVFESVGRDQGEEDPNWKSSISE